MLGDDDTPLSPTPDAAGNPAPPAPADAPSAGGPTPAPPSEGSAAAALAAILRAQAGAFAAALAALGTSDAPEPPHKARVALRRLRSALTGYAPILDDKGADGLARTARKLFRILGPLREADVALASFTAEGEHAFRQAEADRLRTDTRGRLAAAAAQDFPARIEAAIAGGRLWSREARGARLAAAPAPVLSQLALQEAWADVASFGPDLAALDPEERHEFRKDMKRLRYLGEFFGDGWPGERRDDHFRRVEKLQEALGELNDIAVHSGGAALPAELQERHDAALARAGKQWRKVLAAGPWWL